MDFFIIKKILGMMLMPMPLIISVMLLGVFFWFRGKHKWSGSCLLVSTVMLLALSLPPVPNALLYALERQYQQFDLSEPVDFIVVLGCGHVDDASLPITSQLSPCSVIRATEAIRIFQHNPEAKIVTSGNTGKSTFSNAYKTRQFLVAMGVPDSQIVSIEKSRDTEDEAQNLRNLLTTKRFALVSAATHLKRAMGLFKQQQLSPIAAPTHHLMKVHDQRISTLLYPKSTNIMKFERWWYEWLGNTWLSIKAWF